MRTPGGSTGNLLDVDDFYSALVESTDVAIVAKDIDGIILSWNPAAEQLFGYSAEEMKGGSIRRLLPADRQNEEDMILSRIRAGERIAQFFTKRKHKSGRLIDVLATISPIRDQDGKIIGASKLARDAAPILAQQRRLKESEERFRMLADNISQLAWIARPDGRLAWFNKQWYDYTGGTPDEMVGHGYRKHHHPDHGERAEQRFAEALAEGTDWEDTFPLRGADGRYRWFLSRAKPIRDDDGEIIWWFGTNTDVTEQREQQEQIRLLLMEVNHRSKNLLSTVQALARRSAPENAGFISRFEERVRSLAANQDILVRREWREVPVSELVSLQLSFVKGALGGVTAAGDECCLTPRAAEVIGMALHELATNSLKYGALSASGGHVEIGWECRPKREDFFMWWRESGGPTVSEPEHHGFGTTLIREVPRHNLGGEVQLEYRPEGVVWSFRCDDRVLAPSSPS